MSDETEHPHHTNSTAQQAFIQMEELCTNVAKYILRENVICLKCMYGKGRGLGLYIRQTEAYILHICCKLRKEKKLTNLTRHSFFLGLTVGGMDAMS